MVRALLQELKLLSPALVTICGVYLAAGAALFFLIGDRQDKYGGLSTNIFAGSIDTVIVVVLINYLIARTSRQQQRVLRYAAYKQLESGLRIFEYTWVEMLIASSQTWPKDDADLITEETIQHIANHLNLDAPSGIMDSSWQTRAQTGAEMLRDALRQATSRYDTALVPSVLVKCMALEESILLTSLTGLFINSLQFAATRTTMQTPYFLQYASSSSIASFSDVLEMVHDMGREFESEPDYKIPVDFKMKPKWRVKQSLLGSAYVA